MLCKNCKEPVRLMFLNADAYRKGDGVWMHVPDDEDTQVVLVTSVMFGYVRQECRPPMLATPNV